MYPFKILLAAGLIFTYTYTYSKDSPIGIENQFKNSILGIFLKSEGLNLNTEAINRNSKNGEISKIETLKRNDNKGVRVIIGSHFANPNISKIDSSQLIVYNHNPNSVPELKIDKFNPINTIDFDLDEQNQSILVLNSTNNSSGCEFLIAHNNKDLSFTNTFDIPIQMDSRLARSWRVRELNKSSVNMKEIDVEIDLNGLSGVTTKNLRLLVDTDNDGSFIDENPIKGATSSKPDVYTFSGISNISDSNRISFGIKTAISWDGVSFESGSGANEHPSSKDSNLNFYVLGNNCQISEPVHVKNVYVISSANLTLKSGVTMTVEENITIDGNFILEDGASILQSNDTAINSGSGKLTIHRTGKSNDVIYSVWSSPVNSASISTTFSKVNPCDIWTFNAPSQSWKYDYASGYSSICYGNPMTFPSTDLLPNGDGIMNVGIGYFIPGFYSDTRSFSGKINNGTFKVAINKTNLANQPKWANDDWNLIGNPYPSAIDATLFWKENAVENNRIADALYFWDEADTTGSYNQFADYASWNALGGNSSTNTSETPNGYIASGQGFWVCAKNNSNIVFSNAMRTSNNGQFQKQNRSNYENHTVQIGISNTEGFSNNILIGYNNYTSNGYDKAFDAHKLSGNAYIKLASLLNGEEFVIQGIKKPIEEEPQLIPLSVFVASEDIYTFKEYNRNNLSNNYEVHLFDTLTKRNYNLSKENASIHLEENTNTSSRFYLIFKHVPTHYAFHPTDSKITGSTSNQKNKLKAYQKDHQLFIKNNLNASFKLQLIDITGKILLQSQIKEKTILTIPIWNSLTKGTYLLYLENEDSKQTLKVIR